MYYAIGRYSKKIYAKSLNREDIYTYIKQLQIPFKEPVNVIERPVKNND
ncbi:hypothetical protein [Brochothrix campestris]|nr:hypothetical protein [Brochothrix campestris]